MSKPTQHEETMFSYKGKTVLVTGAGRMGRVGAKIARHFALLGSDILLHYHSDADAARLVKEHIEKDAGVAVTLVRGDLSKVEDVRALFAGVVPDITVNNAAVFKHAAAGTNDPLEAARDAFEDNVAANMRGPLLVSTEAVRRLREQHKPGVVVFVGDSFIERGGAYPADLAAYTASKAWVPAVVLQLAAAYGAEGMRFLAVLNGPIEPPPSASAATVEAIAREVNLPPNELKPWIGGEGVAEAIDSLIRAGAANGTALMVDGGRVWRAPSEH